MNIKKVDTKHALSKETSLILFFEEKILSFDLLIMRIIDVTKISAAGIPKLSEISSRRLCV